jgi:hypothetical protein
LLTNYIFYNFKGSFAEFSLNYKLTINNFITLLNFIISKFYLMNNYLTHWQIPRQSVSSSLRLKEGSLRLGKTFKVFLQLSSLVIALLCANTQNSFAQIPAACGTAKLYYYDLFGNWIGPAVTPKLTGGTMDGVLLAQAITNSSPLGKFTGISSGLITFNTAAGEEYYTYNTGAYLAPTRPNKFLPLKSSVANPADGITYTTHPGEVMDKSNPNWIDLADYWAVLKDADGSLSMYDYTTGKYIPGVLFDPTWTTFTGGSLAGKTPSRHSPSNPTGTIDGVEFNLIWHMNPLGNGGNGSLELYSYYTGAYISDISLVGVMTGGKLNNVKIKDALANGLDATVVGKSDVTYLGINRNGAIYQMYFYDATANRILLYETTLGFPPNNTYALLEPTSITPNVLTPNSGPRVLADVLGPKFLGVGFNELSFIDTKGTFEAYIANLPTAPGFYAVSTLPTYCFTNWDGPHAGEMIGDKCSNTNLLGMNDYNYVMKDADGTLSYYGFLGNFLADYCVTTYTGGGVKNGQPITDMTNVLATEDGYVYTLAANGGVDVYISSTGTFVVNWPAAAALKGGPLNGKTLTNAVKAIPCGLTGAGAGTGIPGITYVGTDNGFQVFAVCEADIKVTKGITNVTPWTPFPAWSLVTYEVEAENTGAADLTGVKLLDDIYAQMGACFVGVGSPALPLLPQPKFVPATPAPTGVTINPLFWGYGTATNIFGAGATLTAGQKVKIQFTVLANTSGVCSLANVIKVDAPGVDPTKTSVPSANACPLPKSGTGVTATMNVMCEDQTLTVTPPPSLPTGTWTAFLIDKAKPIINPVTGLPTGFFEASTIPAGTFAGNVFTPNAAAISLNGPVQDVRIVWTPTGPAPACGYDPIVPLSYDVKVNHNPRLSAGSEILSCGAGPIKLSALGATFNSNLSGITTATWTAIDPVTGLAGDGVFIPNNKFNASSQPQYQPGPIDLGSGRITLKLTADGAAEKCTIVSSSVTVKVAGVMICIGKVNLSLTGTDCEVKATPQLLLPYVAFPEDFKVVIEGRANATFTKADIGKCFKVKVTNLCNNTCWGEVCIEDKQAPIIKCPKDVSLLCSDLVGLNADRPCPKFTGDLGLDGAQVGNANDGTAFDCTPLMAGYNPAASCDLTGDEAFADYVFETSCQTPYASGAITSAMVDAAIKDIDKGALSDVITRINTCILTGDVIKVIIRCWRATDHYGNISAPCYQIICVKRIPFKVKGPADKMYSCDGAVIKGACIFPAFPAGGIGANVTGFPVIVLPNGTEIELTGDKAQACNIDYKIISETRIDVCANSYKLIREFKIKDWCSGKDTIVKQEIKVLDVNKPVVRTTYTNYDRVKKTYCYVDAWGVSRTRDAYDVVAKQGTLADFTGENLQCGYNNDGTRVTVNALGDANACNKFNVKFDFIACDPNCTKDFVTVFSNNSKIIVSRNPSKDFTAADGTKNYGYTASGSLSLDDAQIDDSVAYTGECNQTPYCHDVSFTAKDVCGYAIAKQTFRIRLVDNVVPQAVCITSHTASVGTDGTVRINAETFNNGSSDNCGISMFMVRRMTGASGSCGPTVTVDNCYRDYVDFVCADVDTKVMVEMLVVDQNCNINSCMVEVNVQNKQRPVCVAPPATRIQCTEVEKALTNLAQFGEASSYGNCGYSVFEKAPTSAVDNCGVGTITRNWGVKNCLGVEITGLAACTQVITVYGYYDFTVDFPQDVEKTCAGEFESHAQLKARMLNPANFGRVGQDAGIKNDGCGVLVMGIEDDTLMATTGTECMKILRKICVYDWCVYQPNSPNDIYNLNAANSGQELDAAKRIYRDAQTLSGTYKDGYICYVQVLKVVDKTAPNLVAQPDRIICFAKGLCTGVLRDTLVASDPCGLVASTSSLRYSWSILTPAAGKAGGTLEEINWGTGNIVTYPTNLPAGDYTIRWTASDLCGNKQLVVDEFVLTLKDCEAPFILAHEKVGELTYVIGLGTTGAMLMVDAELDLLNNVSDNCTDYGKLVRNLRVQRASDNSNPYATGSTVTNSIMLTCTDVPSVSLRLWTIDEAGNANWVLTTVKVQANRGQCGTTPPPAALAGAVGTENGKAVKGTTITAKANFLTEVNANTVLDGSFAATIVRDQDYVIGASKVDPSDKFLGVTTFDIAKISKHLLDIEKIATPYSLIAADVDMSGEIDGADMLKIRNFILRKSDNLNTSATIWRFVDKSYSFKNAASPLTEDFSTVVSLTKVGDRAVANFVAVKLGDVNTTYTGEAVATVRHAKTLNFTTEDINVVAGSEYTVNIAAENFNAAAFQGTFSFTNATVKAVKGSLLTDANMAIFANAITTSWNGNVKADDIMAITFVANKSGKLSEMLAINSSLTPAVANEANGTEMNVNLKFSNGKVAGGEFALNNATPNPVKFETVIGFNLPKDSKATLTVYTTEGKVLSVKNVDAKAGANQITLLKSDLNATGVMYYRLETPDYSATKKMVVIE